MAVVSAATIPDHLDFLVMQPDHERAVIRDIVSAVMAFNLHGRGPPLQVSFPLFTDAKVARRGYLGPCLRVTGPSEKLYVLTLRYEIAAHLRAARAMTLVRERFVVEAGRNERFGLVTAAGNRIATTSAGSATLANPSHPANPASPANPATPAIALAEARPLVLSGHSRLIETAGQLGVVVKDEAAFVQRAETQTASEGDVDLLGFSDEKTVPVIK